MRKALNFFEEKIKFTYEPIPDVFEEISHKVKDNIGDIFHNSSKAMQNESAGVAWENAVTNANSNFTDEDKDIIKGLAKMLGKTDLDGQVSEIRLTSKFLDVQIKDAENEKMKNEKLYRFIIQNCSHRNTCCCTISGISKSRKRGSSYDDNFSWTNNCANNGY